MAKTSAFPGARKAVDPVKPRIIGASYGEVGTLKTSFWLGAPGPIVVLNFDRGLEGVIEEFQEQKDIYVYDYDANTDGLEQAEAVETRDRMIADFENAVKNARTLVLDKETQMYEIFKYAEFGAPSDQPANYYPLFQRYRRLFNLVKESDINFGVIQGMKTPWAPKVNKKTGAQGAARQDGERVRRGMAEVEEMVHVNIEHALIDGEFKLKIGKARGPGGRAIQNETFSFMPFTDFAQLVFPSTEESDWV